jgi:tetratricopeptide (TPR) repeat protein
MAIDAMNPVVSLCAAGMECEGNPDEARRLFEEAWDARRDDYDASVAAHFLARHQATPADTLHWNALAVRHAEAVSGDRADELKASLYLNLADSYAATGNITAAMEAVNRAVASLDLLPAGGYREFVAMGVRRLQQRLAALSASI